MNTYPHPILAREGWIYTSISVILVIISIFGGLLGWFSLWFSIPFILIAIFVIQFFRDPKRIVPGDDNSILSPADGRIIGIEHIHDVYQDIPAIKISVFMNVFNVHSNRSPADGEVVNVQYFAGKFINADFDKASTENERNAVVLKLNSGVKITFVQIAGLVARRILCYTQVGAKLKRGERYGFIRFGSRVDVYLPLDSVIKVKIGQKVSATKTILAQLMSVKANAN